MARLGVKHHNWKGGRYLNDRGYVLILRPDHPNSRKDGYILEHRFVMSQALGCPLQSGEIVHHKNGDKIDNRLENLQVTTQPAHTESRWQNGKLSEHHIQRSVIECPECGTEQSHYANGLCRRCDHRLYWRHCHNSPLHDHDRCPWCL